MKGNEKYLNLFRTDLAFEAAFLNNTMKTLKNQGVQVRKMQKNGISIHDVTVETEAGERAMGRPRGRYVTLSAEHFAAGDPGDLPADGAVLGEVLREFLEPYQKFLAVGLGNPRVTMDSLGPLCVEKLFVTRHVMMTEPTALPGAYGNLSAIAPGVMGQTGIETAEVIGALIRAVEPDCVIVVDALAARSTKRLNRTIQITNTGIQPGSGVGNHRNALTKESLGIPVIAIGVPTVIYADTILKNPQNPEHELIVTPKEIDQAVADLSKLMGYGLNLALHPELSLSDVTHFLS